MFSLARLAGVLGQQIQSPAGVIVAETGLQNRRKGGLLFRWNPGRIGIRSLTLFTWLT